MERSSLRNLLLIYAAGWWRSFNIGLLGVVLGVYLSREGFSAIAIGLVIAAGLAGMALGTLFITFKADALGRRRTLIALSLLNALGAMPLILHLGLTPLLVLAFFGMMNGMGSDRSPSFALEQAMIPGLVSDQRRTWALAWYSVVLDASGALGALTAGLPILAQKIWGVDLGAGYRALFVGYAAIHLLSTVLYLLLSHEVEIPKIILPGQAAAGISPATKSTVTRLASLFALDSFGGGFLSDALVSY